MFIIKLYWKIISKINSVKFARHLGVSIGKNCFIGIREWSSEPYLITIGSNVAITHGVMLHTHGGGRVLRSSVPNYDAFGKIIIKD